MTSSSSSATPNYDGSYCPTTQTISGETRGEEDSEDLGTLYVYDVRESANDVLSGFAVVTGKSAGAGDAGPGDTTYEASARWRTGWSRGTDTETTETPRASARSPGRPRAYACRDTERPQVAGPR